VADEQHGVGPFVRLRDDFEQLQRARLVDALVVTKSAAVCLARSAGEQRTSDGAIFCLRR
jgi:hypothetical protein